MRPYCAKKDKVEMTEWVQITVYALLTVTLMWLFRNFIWNILPRTAWCTLHRNLCLPPSQCGRGFEHKQSCPILWNGIQLSELSQTLDWLTETSWLVSCNTVMVLKHVASNIDKHIFVDKKVVQLHRPTCANGIIYENDWVVFVPWVRVFDDRRFVVPHKEGSELGEKPPQWCRSWSSL
jgi:hypothetical protein